MVKCEITGKPAHEVPVNAGPGMAMVNVITTQCLPLKM